jgi:hypothetical protein
MISLGCAVRKGSGLAAVITSLTGFQNMSYCVTQRKKAITSWIVKGESDGLTGIYEMRFFFQ